MFLLRPDEPCESEKFKVIRGCCQSRLTYFCTHFFFERMEICRLVHVNGIPMGWDGMGQHELHFPWDSSHVTAS